MTVRVVLAVLVALALVAAAQPAVEHATRTRDDAALRVSVDRTADAVATLYRRNDPGETLRSAPRRTLSIDLPADAALSVHGDPPRLVASRTGRPDHRRPLPVRVETCGDSRALRGRTTLAYVETRDGPTVVAMRGFIRGNGTNPLHACAVRPTAGD